MSALLSSIDSQGPSVYYTDRFRTMVEDHLNIMKQMPTVMTRVITQDDWATLYRFVGDFNGFLHALGYTARYHWVIMRMNGYRSRFDLKLGLEILTLPDWDYVDNLAQLCKEKKRV